MHKQAEYRMPEAQTSLCGTDHVARCNGSRLGIPMTVFRRCYPADGPFLCAAINALTISLLFNFD